MKVLLLDNYDSFTFNLFHLLEAVGFDNINVIRNDEIIIESVLEYELIVLSPGPGIPSEAGYMPEVIALAVANEIPLLGICLGHQAIAEYFGMLLKNLPVVYHGRQHQGIIQQAGAFFNELSSPQLVARYHSWTIAADSFSKKQFNLLMHDQEGEILAMQHKILPVYGLQFHPESVLTPQGRIMMQNFKAEISRLAPFQKVN
jgi:anthranilate synthase component 2